MLQPQCSSNVICSDQGDDYFPEMSRYLICPADPYACENQNYYLYDKETYHNISANYVRQNGECWYKFNRYDSAIKGIKLYNFNFSDALVHIYTDSDAGNFTYQTEVEPGFSGSFELTKEQSIYVLVKHNLTHIDGSISFEAHAYQSSSFSAGVIIVIVISAVVLLVVIG